MLPAARDPKFQTEDISRNMLFRTVWRWAWLILLYYYDAARRYSDEACLIFKIYLGY